MRAPPNETCSSCGEPATNRCSRCSVHVYCGKECQKADWKSHKKICKDAALDKMIPRIADLLQKIYLLFREATFDSRIERIEERGRSIIIHDVQGVRKRGGPLFHKFPNHLVGNDEGIKAASLCFLMCNEPWAFLYEILEQLIQCMDVKLEEVEVSLKNAPRNVIVIGAAGIPQDNADYSHLIGRVTSVLTGKQWVVDITGAQYGFMEPCRQWNAFKSEHIRDVRHFFSFGKYREFITECSKIEGNPSLAHRPGIDAAKIMNESVRGWIGRNVSLSELITLDSGKFQEFAESLLRTINAALTDFIAKSDYSTLRRTAKLHEALNPGTSSREISVLNREILGFGFTLT